MRLITLMLIGAVTAQGQNAAATTAAPNANQPANQQARVCTLLNLSYRSFIL